MDNTKATIKVENLTVVIRELGLHDGMIPGVLIYVYPSEKVNKGEPLNSLFVPFQDG